MAVHLGLCLTWSETQNSVPIHVELCVNNAEIILIMHKFGGNNVHSRTYFSLKNVKHHHFSSFNCESARPDDFCSREESQKSPFGSEMRAVRYYSILFMNAFVLVRSLANQIHYWKTLQRIGRKDIDMRGHVAH